MKTRSEWLVWLMLVFCLVGCGPKAETGVSAEEAAERAGLRREQFSTNAEGKNSIRASDGTLTELLEVDDLGQYGLEIYPGAEAKNGDAYRKTDTRSMTVFFTLFTSDPAKNVGTFYENKLNSRGAKSGETGKIIAGKLSNGKNAVVTVIDEGDKGTRVEVQILGEVEKESGSE